MLEKQSLADPSQASYHNYTLREVALATFALTAVEGHASVEGRAAPLREQARLALDNILETTDLVDPEGSYHESMDYMRITFAPLALLAELRRTTTGEDPARSHGVFRNMGPTYLYKVLPDGTTARDDDNEFPHLMALDNVVLGYAVHRFKDPFAAWMLQKSDWLPEEWDIPVLRFLWNDPAVVPRDPAATSESELPRARLFPGVGHLVMRSGWEKDATWIEYTCGPVLCEARSPRHQQLHHLPQGPPGDRRRRRLHRHREPALPQPVPPHDRPQLAARLSAGRALLLEREPLAGGERRRPAHGLVALLELGAQSRGLPAAPATCGTAGGSRATTGSRAPTSTRGATARAAYNPSKLELFERSLVHLPTSDVLFVFDRVRSRDPAYKKVWLLHGVNEPSGRRGGRAGSRRRSATAARPTPTRRS